jgi:glycosyltransferase involved in cell wall biosynthesis
LKFQPSRKSRAEPRSLSLDAVVTVLECTVRGGGALEVIYATRGERGARFRLVDDQGHAHELTGGQDEPVGLGGVELIGAKAGWRHLEGDRKAKLGVNFGDAWRLPDADTWYLRSPAGGRPVTIALSDPAGGGRHDSPIAGGVPYRFEILAAAHRSRAELKLQLLDGKGRVLESLSRDVSPGAEGGRERPGYDRLSISFRAPSAARALRIAMAKGEGTKGQDSFLFLAAPSLMQDEGQDLADSALPARLAGPAREAELQGLGVRRVWLALPAGAVGAEERAARLEAVVDDRVAASTEVRLRQPKPLEIDRFRFEHGGVRLTGHIQRPAEAGSLRLYVDGRAGMAADLSREGPLDQTLFVDRDLLDGGPHRIEVRNAQGEALYADQVMTPSLVKPLEAGQAYDRAGEADERRVLGLRKWMEKVNRGERLPDLNHLQAVLDGTADPAFQPKLAFPAAPEPQATVILRAGSDLDATYAALAGLLFAANDASVRVKVVAPKKPVGLSKLADNIDIASPAKGQDQNAAIDAEAAEAASDYVVLIEEGHEPTAGWIDELLAAFANFSGVGLAAALSIGADGRLADGGNPYEPDHLHLREVDWGRPFMASRSAWKAAGGLDGDWRHPAYAEADLARRVRGAGLKVILVPTAQVWGLKTAAPAEPEPGEKQRFRVMAGAPKPASGRFRVLFIDQEFPTIDFDAGGYAAFQEIRMLQAMGAEVSFLPRNLGWLDRHTRALERAGVRCLYSPFVRDFRGYVAEHAGDYDLAYVTRYKVALDLMEDLKSSAQPPKIALVLADLHFLREIREAQAGTAGYTLAKARETQGEELRAIEGCDLTLSYSEIEMAVIESHTFGKARVARLPWVTDAREAPIGSYGASRDLLFLGGFGHPPNIDAVKVFVRDVMPLVAERLPGVKLKVVGSKAPQEVLDLQSATVEVVGYVADLDEVFAEARVFVAPLLAGAGIKGKVIEAMSKGVPSVLSPIAAEATGLVDGLDCRIVRSPDEWAAAIAELYGSKKVWEATAQHALAAARRRFSFEAGVAQMREALGLIDVYGPEAIGLVYQGSRPDRYV